MAWATSGRARPLPARSPQRLASPSSTDRSHHRAPRTSRARPTTRRNPCLRRFTLSHSRPAIARCRCRQPGRPYFGVVTFGTMIPGPDNYVRLPRAHRSVRPARHQYRVRRRRHARSGRGASACCHLRGGGLPVRRTATPRLVPGHAAHFGGTVHHTSPRYGMADGWNRCTRRRTPGGRCQRIHDQRREEPDFDGNTCRARGGWRRLRAQVRRSGTCSRGGSVTPISPSRRLASAVPGSAASSKAEPSRLPSNAVGGARRGHQFLRHQRHARNGESEQTR